MSFQPIFIPMPVGDGGSTVPDCPKCGKPENVNRVCAHCGYVYPGRAGPPAWWEHWYIIVPAVILAVAVFLWVFFTFVEWMESDRYGLSDVLSRQAKWFRHKKFW